MYQHILVALDGSETSARALEAALRLARESGAELQPLYVVDVPVVAYDAPGFDPGIIRDAFMEDGKKLADDALSRMQHDNVRGTPRIVETNLARDDSDIAHAILHAAAEFRADLVVMGTHGRRGVRRLMLGSVAERFLHLAQCPVLLIPEHAAPDTGVSEGEVPVRKRAFS
ncbi:MAG: universal stress protein [Paraburkholderia sp.]|uniref:universal stress protein n=1 Tax=Paraburkholderia sp. TaxID=1926495 RepID=UPI003C3B868C